jgi:hypothetical protein
MGRRVVLCFLRPVFIQNAFLVKRRVGFFHGVGKPEPTVRTIQNTKAAVHPKRADGGIIPA